MKIALFFIFIICSYTQSITTYDFVKVLNGFEEETLFYYEKNWKSHRDIAIKEGVIKSYRLLKQNKQNPDYDIILITEYKNKTQYNNREKNFRKIIDRRKGKGPILLNSVPRKEFRKVVFSHTLKTIYENK